MVASHLQTTHSMLAESFCAHHNIPLTATNIHGLREAMRFLYSLRGIPKEKYNQPRRHLKRKFVCRKLQEEHSKLLFEYLGLEHNAPVWITDSDVYCELTHLLHPKDTAYWWTCPGAMVKLVLPQHIVKLVLETLVGAPTQNEPTCELLLGRSTDEAYAAAAAHCTSYIDLVEKIVATKVVVAAWTIQPGQPENCPWSFKVDKIL
jgi:hypothetical protein